jgi:hypothetical protein
MRRGWIIGAAVAAVLVVAAIAFGAYNVGLDEGIRRGAAAGEVVEVVGRGYGWGHRPGFFPLGLLLFPLLVIGCIWLVAAAFRRGPWGDHHHGGWGGPGAWSDDARARFEERFGEWHRRQHEAGPQAADPSASSG